MQNLQISIKRKSDVIARLGIGRSTLQNRINDGIFPPPISIGGRTVGWLEHEIDATIIAMLSDKPIMELRKDINKIISSRATIQSNDAYFGELNDQGNNNV